MVKKKFTEAAASLRVGDGLDEKTQMGPVVSAAHKQRVLNYIQHGIKDGADLTLDGRDIKVPGYDNGFFIGPTIFDNVKPDMTIAREEIFGPVVSTIHAKDLNEAINLVNSPRFCQRRLHLYQQRPGGARIQVPGQAEHGGGQHRHRGPHELLPLRRRR